MKNLTILLLLVATITVNAADIVVNGSGLAGTYTTISAAVQEPMKEIRFWYLTKLSLIKRTLFLLIKGLLYYPTVILLILILKGIL